ncbi:MAG: carboxymuconolactone decarboxylase family protein [Bryobacterales bacterium]|nr:carboxymuconolactone decarboxylase family protein [Bryobacterales bacterium]
MSNGQPTPEQIKAFEQDYPQVWQAFTALAEACHESAGPLDEKTRRLVKLALAIGNRHEGAVHSAVRQALGSGLTRAELRHVVVLAITTIGWPAAHAALTWIDDLAADPEATT